MASTMCRSFCARFPAGAVERHLRWMLGQRTTAEMTLHNGGTSIRCLSDMLVLLVCQGATRVQSNAVRAVGPLI
jgi:hypothetical protein